MDVSASGSLGKTLSTAAVIFAAKVASEDGTVLPKVNPLPKLGMARVIGSNAGNAKVVGSPGSGGKADVGTDETVKNSCTARMKALIRAAV
jgi:hypothetical protein